MQELLANYCLHTHTYNHGCDSLLDIDRKKDRYIHRNVTANSSKESGYNLESAKVFFDQNHTAINRTRQLRLTISVNHVSFY